MKYFDNNQNRRFYIDISIKISRVLVITVLFSYLTFQLLYEYRGNNVIEICALIFFLVEVAAGFYIIYILYKRKIKYIELNQSGLNLVYNGGVQKFIAWDRIADIRDYSGLFDKDGQKLDALEEYIDDYKTFIQLVIEKAPQIFQNHIKQKVFRIHPKLNIIIIIFCFFLLIPGIFIIFGSKSDYLEKSLILFTEIFPLILIFILQMKVFINKDNLILKVSFLKNTIYFDDIQEITLEEKFWRNYISNIMGRYIIVNIRLRNAKKINIYGLKNMIAFFNSLNAAWNSYKKDIHENVPSVKQKATYTHFTERNK